MTTIVRSADDVTRRQPGDAVVGNVIQLNNGEEYALLVRVRHRVLPQLDGNKSSAEWWLSRSSSGELVVVCAGQATWWKSDAWSEWATRYDMDAALAALVEASA